MKRLFPGLDLVRAEVGKPVWSKEGGDFLAEFGPVNLIPFEIYRG